jgi:hypothetical protein
MNSGEGLTLVLEDFDLGMALTKVLRLFFPKTSLSMDGVPRYNSYTNLSIVW